MIGKKTFAAVILAGGSSTRMKGQSKQQALLCGLPVAVRSMRAFEEAEHCREIVVSAKEDELSLYEGYAKEYGITKFKCAVVGGATRQESAAKGLAAISEEPPYVAFHDAARCLILPSDIERVFAVAVRRKSASACAPCTDTVKLTDGKGRTLTSGQPDRSLLVSMQTPQIFYADLYRAAAHAAAIDGFVGTDDCSLTEHAGFGCALVDCGKTNIKITYPEDLAIAEAILRLRESEQKE